MPFDDFDNDDFDFNDDDFDAEEFAKEFEQRSANAKSQPLYKQIIEVYETLKVLLDNADNENDYLKANKELLIESVFIIRAKLYSALQSDSYIVCMSNAAEIRKHADYLLLSSVENTLLLTHCLRQKISNMIVAILNISPSAQ